MENSTVNFPQNTDKGSISNASGDTTFPVLHVFRRTGKSEVGVGSEVLRKSKNRAKPGFRRNINTSGYSEENSDFKPENPVFHSIPNTVSSKFTVHPTPSPMV